MMEGAVPAASVRYRMNAAPMIVLLSLAAGWPAETGSALSSTPSWKPASWT